ncbi:MAG: glycosyl hydrolase family 65 protein, partial [Terriglobia bacterium]
SYDGLQISPVIPKSWRGFKATRIFRGVTYHITIERAGEGNHVALEVDGVPIKGDTVRPPADGRREVLVQATLS